MKPRTPGFWLIVTTVGLLTLLSGCSDSPAEKKRKFEEYRAQAENGQPWAQDKLGYCYAAGEGVDKNDDEALKWFRKASHVTAGQVSAEALKFFRKAAEGGNADAQYEMGFACDDTLGSVFDRTESRMWFRKSAEQGHPESQCYVGIEYVSHSGGGWGHEPDDVEAAKWLRKAAEQGNPKAQPWLSSCDERIAKTLALRMLAIQGDAEAQSKLARCYYNGDGAHLDRIEALAFWILLGTTDKKGKWGTDARLLTRIGFCKSAMSPGAIAKGEQRAKELQKEVEANNAAKKAGK